MKLLRSFPVLVFVLVLLSIGALCAAQRSLQMLLVAGTLAAISWYITEGPRGRTLPRWVSNLLVIGVVLNLFVDLLQHRQDPLGVLGRFAVWLTLIKLYERRSARDHAQLMLLSLLLIITGCLQAPADFLMGLVLLVYSALGLYLLLLLQLHTAFERSRDARYAAIPGGYRLVPPLRPVVGRRAGLHFRSQTAAIGGIGALLSIICFVATPRGMGADFLGSLHSQLTQRKTGFVNQVDLLAGGRINDSRILMMTVQLTDDANRPVRLDRPLLLRGGVCDRYEGKGRWRPGGEPPHIFDISPRSAITLGSGAHENGRTLTQRVDYLRPVSDIFAAYAPISFSCDRTFVLQYDHATQVLFTTSGCLLTGYTVKFQPDPSDKTLENVTYQSPQRIRNSGWFSDPGGLVRELAKQILAAAGLNAEDIERFRRDQQQWPTERAALHRKAADAFVRHLQSGEYRYTLDLSDVIQPSGQSDPITQFLLETRRGHCEYFASGLTALCHSVGIPARIVTGYAAYEYNQADQHYEVFESNAHAWVEVLTGPHRWSALDPTPPAALAELGDEQTFADTMRSFYQRIEGNWSSSIVAFDSGAQDRLADSLNFGWSKWLSDALQAVRDWMERVNIFFNVGPGGYIWMGIVAAALVIAVIALVKLMRRSRAIRRITGLQYVRGAEYQRMLRQLGFYLDMLRVLKRGGLNKPPWQPPLVFAQTLARRNPSLAVAVREITGMFYQVRYGRRRLTQEQRQRVRQMLSELAGTLKVRM